MIGFSIVFPFTLYNRCLNNCTNTAFKIIYYYLLKVGGGAWLTPAQIKEWDSGHALALPFFHSTALLFRCDHPVHPEGCLGGG